MNIRHFFCCGNYFYLLSAFSMLLKPLTTLVAFCTVELFFTLLNPLMLDTEEMMLSTLELLMIPVPATTAPFAKSLLTALVLACDLMVVQEFDNVAMLSRLVVLVMSSFPVDL